MTWEIIIPAEIEGLPVLEVEALAYVKLPAGIKEWEDKDDPDLYHIAFKSSLTGRGIPINSLPSFNNCDKLKTVIIPEGIKAMPEFRNCKVLDSISLPSTVEYLSEYAFNGCASLKEVNIPDSVEKIAFYYIGEHGNSGQEQFVGTNFNLATQTRLKQLGYEGSFGAY